MKCPRCETENGQRNVCKKCGMFLYDGKTKNRVRMSPGERRVEDAKKGWRITKKILRVIWLIIVVLVMSYLMIYLITIYFG